MKFQPPEQWASALVNKQGKDEAARIALHEARPMYGKDEVQTVNHNAPYFKTAYNWIKKRHKIVTAKKSETPTVKDHDNGN